MTLGRKDAAATVLTALVVLTFFATQQGWNVALVGERHRWATGVILVLGAITCSLGNAARGGAVRLLGLLGVLALVLGVWALWSASLTPLSLLVVDIVLLWGAATIGHLQPGGRHRVAL